MENFLLIVYRGSLAVISSFCLRWGKVFCYVRKRTNSFLNTKISTVYFKAKECFLTFITIVH